MTNAFEQGLLRGFPRGEAAAFFVSVKTAGWEEPPDEQGVLEGQFAVPIEQVVHKLGEIISIHARKMLAYYTYAQSLRGEMWRAVKTEFYEHAEHEQEALEFYLKRAAVLGSGPVHMDAIEPPPASAQPIDIFKLMARAEQESIAAQRELRTMVGDENPMKVGIEEYMLQDQHHLDEMWQMIPQGTDVAPVAEPPMEEGLEEEAELPPEEAAPEVEPKQASAVQKAQGIKRLGQLLSGSRATALEGAERTRRMSQARASRSSAKNFSKALESSDKVGDLVRDKKLPWAKKALKDSGKNIAKANDANRRAGTTPVSRYMSAGWKEKDKVLGTRAAAGFTVAAAGAGTAAAAAHAGKKKKASVEDPKEKGKERAVTNLAAEAHREKGRRGERVGGTLGSIAGTLGGAALGGKHLRGPSGKAVGAGLGYLLGGKVGKEVGTEADIRKNASVAFLGALAKLGFGGAPAGGVPPEAALSAEAVPPPMMDPQAAEPMEPPPPEVPLTEPTNYLEAEQMARDAEEQNQSAYYRQKMQEAMAQMQGMQQQFQETQGQLDSLQQQSAESMSQIGERTQQAIEANQVATAHAQEAANLRIGLEKMRQQMMGVVAQDPETLAQPPMADPTMDPMADPSGMEAGMDPSAGPVGADQAGAEGAPGAAPPAASPAGEEASAASGEGGSTVDETAEQAQAQKMGSAMEAIKKHGPWALAGAGIGAATGLMAGKHAPALREKVEGLSSSREQGNYEQTQQLAKTYAQLGRAEQSEKSPGRAALSGGLGGALLLGAAGPRIPAAAKGLAQNLRQLVQ